MGRGLENAAVLRYGGTFLGGELGESHGQPITIGVLRGEFRYFEFPPMHVLQTVSQHRPVDLIQQIPVNSYLVVGSYSQEISVV